MASKRDFSFVEDIARANLFALKPSLDGLAVNRQRTRRTDSRNRRTAFGYSEDRHRPRSTANFVGEMRHLTSDTLSLDPPVTKQLSISAKVSPVTRLDPYPIRQSGLLQRSRRNF
jgi:hypothetical protein